MHQSIHQLVERLVKSVDTFVLKLLGHLINVNSEFRQALQNPVGVLDILFDAGFRFAVVAVGV